jgi:hypothetical protein
MAHPVDSILLDTLSSDVSTPDPAQVRYVNSVGALPVATQALNGFMSAADKAKIDTVIANGSGDDWLSGLCVSIHSPANQTVDYTSGSFMVNGVVYNVNSGGNYDLRNGYGGVNHYSALSNGQRASVLIYVDSSCTIKSVAGPATSACHPVKPDIPNDTVALAFLIISKGSGGALRVIDYDDITDARQARQPIDDELVKISSADTISGFLGDKLTNDGNVHFTKENADANESLKADVQFGSSATTACVGNDARLSDDRTASGLRSATTVVAVSAATAPTAGQVLTATAGNAANWQTPSGGGGGITAEQHRSISQLIHYVEGGPDSSAYRETLPAGSAFPTSITWWDSSSKNTKFVEKLITWSGAYPSQIQWKVYSGGVVQDTLTDTYDYTGGNQFTPKVTRVRS